MKSSFVPLIIFIASLFGLVLAVSGQSSVLPFKTYGAIAFGAILVIVSVQLLLVYIESRRDRRKSDDG